MEKPIFIYGVPGSGKTYISQKMANDLKLPLSEADMLKDELRKFTTKEESPFLFLGTCQAYRHFGELSDENAIKGLKAVRHALANGVSEEVKKRGEAIIEGAFLDPNLLKDNGKMILIVTINEEKHRNQFFQHRETSDLNFEEFKAARIIQNFLIKEAKDLDIEIMENK